MKTTFVLGLSVLAVLLSSPVFAEDRSQVVEWVKDKSVAAQGVGAGALYFLKADQIAILKKASPEFAEAYKKAVIADGNAHAAAVRLDEYRSAVGILYDQPSSAQWDRFYRLRANARDLRAEAKAQAAVAKHYSELAVKEMKESNQALYKKYVGAGIWNKVVRPVGIGALTAGAVMTYRALNQSQDIEVGEQARSNPARVAKGIEKPVVVSENNVTDALLTHQQGQADAGAAR